MKTSKKAMKKEFRDCDQKLQRKHPLFKRISDLLDEIAPEKFNNTVILFPHIILGDFMGKKNVLLTYMDNNKNPIYNSHSIVFNITFDSPDSKNEFDKRDFEFVWIYDFTNKQLQSIIKNLEVGKEKNKEYQQKTIRRRELTIYRQKPNKEVPLTFGERKELWRLNDYLHDTSNGHETNPEILANREKMYNKTEKQYEKENKMMDKIFAELNLKK